MPAQSSLLPPGLGFLGPIVQDNTLAREFRDALYPQILYRSDATPEKWEINVGDVQVFTRASLLAPVTRPLTPGEDPGPKQPSFEQWEVKAAQYGDAIDTHMPSSRTAASSLFMRNAKTLGLQAGQSINRVCRNKLFFAYLGGDTVAADAGAATADLPVAAISGFTHVTVNGQRIPVSAQHPKAIRIGGVAGTVNVVSAAPIDAANPFGPGILTLEAPATWAADARVVATDAPEVMRAGGATTVDDLTATTHPIRLQEIRMALAKMARNRVPKHPDGFYHCHLDPMAAAQLLADNEMQRLWQSQGIPQDSPYSEFVIGAALGCLFISNNESPNAYTSGDLLQSRAFAGGAAQALYSPEYYAEVRNANGVAVVRTIITGGGSIMEKYIDEAEYSSDAGYTGKVGAFNIANNGMQVPVDRVRYILRSPLDRLQQMVSQAWSFSGDWGVPSDQLGGQTAARFKRSIVIESGSED